MIEVLTVAFICPSWRYRAHEGEGYQWDPFNGGYGHLLHAVVVDLGGDASFLKVGILGLLDFYCSGIHCHNQQLCIWLLEMAILSCCPWTPGWGINTLPQNCIHICLNVKVLVSLDELVGGEVVVSKCHQPFPDNFGSNSKFRSKFPVCWIKP